MSLVPSRVLALFLLLTLCVIASEAASIGEGRIRFRGGTIPWATLTQYQLGNLSIEAIAGATPADLHALPPSSCVGWQSDQIAALTGACAGFDQLCIRRIKVDAIAQMGDVCANSIGSTTSFGFTSDQLHSLPSTAWSALTATALAGLDPQACTGITPEAIAYIGTASQKFPAVVDACAGLTGPCIAAAPDNIFSQLTRPCAIFTQPTCWAALKPEQVANISADAFPVISPSQLSSLQPNSCVGLQPSQVSVIWDLGPLAPILAPRVCTGFTPECVAQISTQSIGAFTTDCIGDLNSTVFSLLTTDQISAISINGSMGLLRDDINALVACDGLTLDQIGVLGTYFPPFDTCAGFQSACLSMLTPAHFESIQPTCLSLIPPEAFQHIDAEQVAMLSPATTQGLTADQLRSLPAEACRGFSSDQIVLFGTISPYDTCSGFTTDCLQALSGDAFGSLTSACFSSIPSNYISSFTLEQLSQISHEALSGVTGAQVVEWTQAYGQQLIGGIWSSTGLMALLSANTILGFKQAIQQGVIQPAYTLHDPSVLALSAITSLQVAYCMTTCMDLLLSSGAGGAKPNILFLPLLSYRGLRGDQLASIPPNIFAQFSGSVFSQLLSDATNAITPSQVVEIAIDRFTSLDIGQINIEKGTVAALTIEQIQSVEQQQWLTQWNCDQYNNFTIDQRAAMGAAEQRFEIDCSGGTYGSSNSGPTYSQTVFLASVIGGIGGAFLLSALIYVIFLRRRVRQAPRTTNLTLDGEATIEYSGSNSSGARRRTLGRQIKDVSLRQPLHPNGVPVGMVQPGSSPVLPPLQPSYSQAELQDHLDDEDDIVGSRF